MVFQIKKGKHRSWYFPKFIWRNTLNFSFEFLSNPEYICFSENNQEDINKIYGFSDSWFHHKDSVRIGWYFDKNSFLCDLVVYCYTDGKRVIKSLGDFKINDKININIEIIGDIYVVTRKDIGIVHLIPRKSKWWGPRYLLFPYFGGQEKAPKKFTIKIN